MVYTASDEFPGDLGDNFTILGATLYVVVSRLCDLEPMQSLVLGKLSKQCYGLKGSNLSRSV